MKSFTTAASVLLAAMVAIVSVGNAEEAAKKVTTVKCPVAGKEIKIADAKTVSYKKANVYVCCGKCKAAMEKDSKKFATKANHQLIQTKQAKQVKCPLSGGSVNAEQNVKVAGVKVGFCCGKCKAKVAGAEGDAQLELVFSEDAFKKGYEVKEKKAE